MPPASRVGRQALGAAQTRGELLGIFREAVAPHGFTAFAIGFVPGPGGSSARDPFLLLDWPRAWLELYARRGFVADDIVVCEAQRTREPFTWTQVQRRYPGVSAAIFEAARSFGWSDGFVVPVHDLRGGEGEGERCGVVSLAATSLRGFDAEAERHVLRLSLAAFARARTLLRAERPEAAEVHLTRREREVLALVARGLSDAQIGTTLGFTTATAHFHIERAKRRLGATTRAQAVALALTQRLM